ncbi:MAG: hypothetical protein H7A37_06790 [Chlamydiales bacterium]|nr:hypothetical protein [Chlamydiia bacterium]MCP5507988.1 hypothetical protein [Chlamydiales bacterium]
MEELINEAQKHSSLYHVAIGNSKDGNELAIPEGSGTLVTFSSGPVPIYGVLTAAHVLKKIRYQQTNRIGLSKAISYFDQLGCFTNFKYVQLDEKNNSDFPDLGFICLGCGESPKHELFDKSAFYDLGSNMQLPTEDDQVFSTFIKGTSSKSRPDGLLNTFTAIGGGEKQKRDPSTGCDYWTIPNLLKESIEGASGAGFWRYKSINNRLHKSLEGVVISQSNDFSECYATGEDYLCSTFFEKLLVVAEYSIKEKFHTHYLS